MQEHTMFPIFCFIFSVRFFSVFGCLCWVFQHSFHVHLASSHRGSLSDSLFARNAFSMPVLPELRCNFVSKSVEYVKLFVRTFYVNAKLHLHLQFSNVRHTHTHNFALDKDTHRHTEHRNYKHKINCSNGSAEPWQSVRWNYPWHPTESTCISGRHCHDCVLVVQSDCKWHSHTHTHTY